MKYRSLIAAAAVTCALAAGTLTGCSGQSVTVTSTASDSAVTEITSSPAVTESSAAESAAESTPADVIEPEVIAPESVPAVTEAPTATPTPSPTPTVSLADGTAGHINTGCNLRAEADGDSEIIQTIEAGERVTILGTDGNWTHVQYDSWNGWVYSSYVSEGAYTRSSDDEEEEEASSSQEETESESEEETEETSGQTEEQ